MESDREVGRPASAHVAQPVEHTLGKGVAMGSNPIVGSKVNYRVQ